MLPEIAQSAERQPVPIHVSLATTLEGRLPSPQSIVTFGLRPLQPWVQWMLNPPTSPEKTTPAVALNAFGGGVAPAVETPPASEPTITATIPASRVITTRHRPRIYDARFFAWPRRTDPSLPHATPSGSRTSKPSGRSANRRAADRTPSSG